MKILYEMVFVGEHDGLDAVARIDFRQDMRDMRFHGRQADEQLVRDLLIRQAMRDFDEHLALAVITSEFLRTFGFVLR